MEGICGKGCPTCYPSRVQVPTLFKGPPLTGFYLDESYAREANHFGY
jgi:hypothetical protein